MIIKMNNDKSLSTIKSSTNYKLENKAEELIILVPTIYGHHDITEYSIRLNMINQEDVGSIIELYPETELYNEIYLQYKIDMTSEWTYLPGKITVWLTINNSEDLVLETGTTNIIISDTKSIEEFIPEQNIPLIDQLITRINNLEIAIQNGTGVPVGGAIDQYLRKTGTENFETAWSDIYQPSSCAIFVSKEGSDLNNGLSPIHSLLTITAATNKSQELQSSGTTKIVIYVLDAGIYIENISLPSDVDLYGKAATIVGRMDIRERSNVWTRARYPSENSQFMIYKAGVGISNVYSDLWDGRGLDGALSGGTFAYNYTSNAILYVGGKVMYVPANASAIRENSSGFGHIHLNVDDLYLAGNFAKAIHAQGANSHIVAYVQHILNLGTVYNTDAIRLEGVNSRVEITANEIVANNAYRITAGELCVNCPLISGSKIGTAKFDLQLLHEHVQTLINNI